VGRFDTVIQKQAVETNRSSAPTWTFGYAIFWGGLSAVMPLTTAYPSPTVAITTSILGLLVIGLGYAVYRRSLLAAWILVAFSLFDVVSRIIHGHSGFIMPGLLFLFALNAAISLRKPMQVSTIVN
jgi:hypothetical protein